MNITPKRIIPIIAILFFAGSCGVVPRTGSPPSSSPVGSSGESVSPPIAASVSTYNEAQSTLMQAYREWKGTPYVLGGASASGVDCSSFVRIVFENYFNLELPSNTRTQLNAGSGVRRLSLRTGDLVFFRTGRKTLHVGIITEGKDFLHASTSKGVMISSLSEYYWSSRYLAARRVI